MHSNCFHQDCVYTKLTMPLSSYTSLLPLSAMTHYTADKWACKCCVRGINVSLSSLNKYMNILPVLPYKTLWMDICVASLIYCLVVKFSKDCASHSCMDHLQPALCVPTPWRLQRNASGDPECLANNIVSLVDPVLPVRKITNLVNAKSYCTFKWGSTQEKMARNCIPKIC